MAFYLYNSFSGLIPFEFMRRHSNLCFTIMDIDILMQHSLIIFLFLSNDCVHANWFYCATIEIY